MTDIKTLINAIEIEALYNCLNQDILISSKSMNDVEEAIRELSRALQPLDKLLSEQLTEISNVMFAHDRRSGGYYIGRTALLGKLDLIIDIINTVEYKRKFNKSKIFVSHASADIAFVKPFVDLLNKIGLNTNEHLFCSSVPGFGIPQGMNIYEYLRSEFVENNIYVIFMLSENYYKSAASLNEMGAAWALNAEYQSILLPGFNFTDIDGAINPLKMSFKLDDNEKRRYSMNEVKDKILKKVGLSIDKGNVWEGYRDSFFKAIDSANAMR